MGKSTRTSKKEAAAIKAVPVEVIAGAISNIEEDEELAQMLREVDDGDAEIAASANEEEIEGAVTDLEFDEELAASHIESEPEPEADAITTVKEKKTRIKAEKSALVGDTIEKISDAALLFTLHEASLTEEEKEELIEGRKARMNALPKKVGEKAINLIQSLTGSGAVSAISVYTRHALDLLKEDGQLTSATLRSRYLKRPYTAGTASAQTSQMMRLLPELGIATLAGGVLTPAPKSRLFDAYCSTK